MVVTLVALQTDHGKPLIGRWRCKTMLFAGDVCTGKDCATGPVGPFRPPPKGKILNISLDVCTFLAPDPHVKRQNWSKTTGIYLPIANWKINEIYRDHWLEITIKPHSFWSLQNHAFRWGPSDIRGCLLSNGVPCKSWNSSFRWGPCALSGIGVGTVQDMHIRSTTWVVRLLK